MPDLSFTPTTNAAAIPTVIAQKVITQLSGYMNLGKTVSRDTDFEQSFRYGDTLKIDKTGALTAGQKTPGSAVVTQNPTLNSVNVSLNNHWYVSYTQEDITKALQKPNVLDAYARDAAIVLAETIETKIAALWTSATSVVTMDYASAATIEASFLNLRARFARNKVPSQLPKYAYLDTSVINKLLTVDRFTNSATIGGKGGAPIVDGALARIAGINIFESQLVPTTGSPVAYHSLAYGSSGIVYAPRMLALDGNGRGAVQTMFLDENTGTPLRMTESYDDVLLGVKTTFDVLFGTALVDQRYVNVLESF